MSTSEDGKKKIKPVWLCIYAIIVILAIFVIYQLTKITGSTYVIGK